MTTTPVLRRPGFRVRVLAVLLAGCAALAACGAPQQSADGRQQITYLNVLPMESLSFAAEMVAETKGFFAAHGLDVKFQSTQGSAPAIQTVLAGSALVTRIGDIETMIAAGQRNAPVTAFGELIHKNTIRMISTEAAPIRRAADFRGKLVGTPSEGGTSSITLDMVVGSAKVPPAEVRRQVVGLSPGVFDLLTAGRVDAYIVSLDTAMLLDRTRPEAVVYDPNEAVAAGAQVYVTSTRQAADPAAQDKLKRFMAAIDDAAKFIIADEQKGFAETIALISGKYKVAALADPETARAGLAAYVAAYRSNDSLVGISAQRWAATYSEIVGVGQLPPGLDPARWVNPSFAPASP